MLQPAFIEENIPLAPHISFKVGGSARFYCAPKSKEEISSALAWASSEKLPFFLLGKGTNLVFSDAGYPGLVIHMGRYFNGITWQDNRVRGQSGALLQTLVTQSVKKHFAGIQHLAGIPGTLGGGTYINAGAFGQELCEVITSVTSCTFEGEIQIRSNKECEFNYRNSNFFKWKEIILETEMQLLLDEVSDLEAEMRETLVKRKTKQPVHLPNAGSIFKRPPGTYAGLLIENAHLKGLRRGGAQVSEQHANFIVNTGGATAQDIWDLSCEVINKVEKDCGITLEREVIFVGDFQSWPR